MNCRHVQGRLPLYLDGDVPGADRDGIEEHLRGCAACRAERARLRRSWEVLDRYEAPGVGSRFTASVMARVPAGRFRARKAGSRFLRYAAIWAAGFAAALGLLLLRRPAPPAAPRQVGPPARARVATEDETIVRDLEIYENVDMLRSLDFMADLDVVERLDDLTS